MSHMTPQCPPSIARAIAYALGLLASTANADGPGMLLYSGNYRPEELLRAPFKRYRLLAEVGVQPSGGGRHGAVQANGIPVIFNSTGSPFAAIPQEANDVVQLGIAGNFILAINRTGQAVTWPITPVWMPAEPLVDLAVFGNTAAAVGGSGAAYVWNSAAQVPTSPSLPASTRVSLSSNWGMVVTSSGSTLTFGYAGANSPGNFSSADVRDISVGGTTGSPRAVAIRTDGSLVSLTTALVDHRQYEKACVGSSALLALETSGVVRSWSFNGTIGEWVNPGDYVGRFRDIALAPLGAASPMVICASDTDRDGEEDLEQIIRGEIPDVNGDLIDDRVQGANVLRDENANGTPDASELPAISNRHKPASVLWFAGSLARQAGFFALDRVPVQAELLRAVRLNHLTEDVYGVSLIGRSVTYGVWLDPDGDGSPVDAVEVFRAEVTIQKNRLIQVELGGLEIGPPGTSFFHGLTYSQGGGLPQPALFPADAVPATTTDPFDLSRLRAKCWYGYREAGSAPASPLELLRSANPWELLGASAESVLSNLALSWNDRKPFDCNADGILDEYAVNGLQPFWIADMDIDRDGLLDTCEQDCDLDGVEDVRELFAGAVDCNLDLIPDSCVGGAFATEQTAAVPSPSAPIDFVFESLPAASSDISITVEAVADLGAPTELLLFRFEAGTDLAIFGPTGSDCPAAPDVTGFTIPKTEFEAAIADGFVQIRIASSALVDPLQCPNGFVRVRLEYQQAASDCDIDGVNDECQHGQADCDGNGVPDRCEVTEPGKDLDGNGVLDACEFDCNRDGTPDAIQIASDPALDCDNSGYLDECEFIDCNQNGVSDPCDLANGIGDCNGDGLMDACQLLPDCDSDGIPDDCETDCDSNGTPDECDTANGAPDKDLDGVPDACEYARGDFDLDGTVGAPDLAYLLSVWGATGISIGDLNGDGVIGAQDLTIFLSRWGPA